MPHIYQINVSSAQSPDEFMQMLNQLSFAINTLIAQGCDEKFMIITDDHRVHASNPQVRARMNSLKILTASHNDNIAQQQASLNHELRSMFYVHGHLLLNPCHPLYHRAQGLQRALSQTVPTIELSSSFKDYSDHEALQLNALLHNDTSSLLTIYHGLQSSVPFMSGVQRSMYTYFGTAFDTQTLYSFFNKDYSFFDPKILIPKKCILNLHHCDEQRALFVVGNGFRDGQPRESIQRCLPQLQYPAHRYNLCQWIDVKLTPQTENRDHVNGALSTLIDAATVIEAPSMQPSVQSPRSEYSLFQGHPQQESTQEASVVSPRK